MSVSHHMMSCLVYSWRASLLTALLRGTAKYASTIRSLRWVSYLSVNTGRWTGVQVQLSGQYNHLPRNHGFPLLFGHQQRCNSTVQVINTVGQTCILVTSHEASVLGHALISPITYGDCQSSLISIILRVLAWLLTVFSKYYMISNYHITRPTLINYPAALLLWFPMYQNSAL